MSTCITERPTLDVGKSTGTVQRPHWGDSLIESLNLDGALRGYYSSKTAQNYGFPVVGPLGAFPPGGFLVE